MSAPFEGLGPDELHRRGLAYLEQAQAKLDDALKRYAEDPSGVHLALVASCREQLLGWRDAVAASGEWV